MPGLRRAGDLDRRAERQRARVAAVRVGRLRRCPSSAPPGRCRCRSRRRRRSSRCTARPRCTSARPDGRSRCSPAPRSAPRPPARRPAARRRRPARPATALFPLPTMLPPAVGLTAWNARGGENLRLSRAGAVHAAPRARDPALAHRRAQRPAEPAGPPVAAADEPAELAPAQLALLAHRALEHLDLALEVVRRPLGVGARAADRNGDQPLSSSSSPPSRPRACRRRARRRRPASASSAVSGLAMSSSWLPAASTPSTISTTPAAIISAAPSR